MEKALFPGTGRTRKLNSSDYFRVTLLSAANDFFLLRCCCYSTGFCRRGRN